MSKLLKNVALAVGGFVAGVLVTKALTPEEEVFEYCYEDLTPEELEELYGDLDADEYEVALTAEELEKIFKPFWDEYDKTLDTKEDSCNCDEDCECDEVCECDKTCECTECAEEVVEEHIQEVAATKDVKKDFKVERKNNKK